MIGASDLDWAMEQSLSLGSMTICDALLLLGVDHVALHAIAREAAEHYRGLGLSYQKACDAVYLGAFELGFRLGQREAMRGAE